MDVAYLVLTSEPAEVPSGVLERVHILPDPFSPGPPTLNGEHYRVSPIFPVEQGAPIPDLGRCTVCFFTVERAFEVLGWIRTWATADQWASIWFSHGLASIVVFAPDHALGDEIISRYGARVWSWELWDIKDGLLETRTLKLSTPATVDSQQFQLPVPDGLRSDEVFLVDELRHNINKTVALSRHHAPFLLPTLSRFVRPIAKWLEELAYLHDPTRPCPAALAKKREYLEGNVRAREMRRNHIVDRLVQLNSAFSYVISQAFAGAVPISRDESLFESYSLLGVGTAFTCVTQFARFVEKVFEKYPVDRVVRTKFPSIPGFDAGGSLEEVEGPRAWERHQYRVDSDLQGLAPVPSRPNLFFFSGRLGFKETPVAITAAMQVLAKASTTRWSLMTFSHELLHSHVRGLLSALFSAEHEQLPTEQKFHRYYQKYCDFLRIRRSGRLDDFSLADTLRFGVFNFCWFRYLQEREIHGNGVADGVMVEVGNGITQAGMSETVLWDLLRLQYQHVNEIVTHVLDYKYFYNSRPEVYLALLWESWSAVPSVLENVTDYVLRSLAAVGTRMSGSPVQRFDSARAILEGELRALQPRVVATSGQSVLIDSALAVLAEEVEPLRKLFLPTLYLADIVDRFLSSMSILSELFPYDPNFDKDAGQFEYEMEYGSFPGSAVTSPVALLIDRLQRAVRDEGGGPSDSYRSAWLFLACASCPEEG